jgi:hypothetical protein
VSAGAISAVGPVPSAEQSEASAAQVMPTLAPRRPVELGRWIPYLVWGAAAIWLAVSFALFRAEPLGLFPVSPGRVAALDQVRTVRARAELIRLADEVGRYAAVVGVMPSGLEVLGGRDPGVAARLLDPWTRPYQIRAATDGPGGEASLFSAGPDGRFGTPDDIVVGTR